MGVSEISGFHFEELPCEAFSASRGMISARMQMLFWFIVGFFFEGLFLSLKDAERCFFAFKWIGETQQCVSKSVKLLLTWRNVSDWIATDLITVQMCVSVWVFFYRFFPLIPKPSIRLVSQ